MSAFDQTGQTVGHQVNQYADERREITEKAMRTWQHKYDMEHEAHERTKDALAASEAARSVLREALENMTDWAETTMAESDTKDRHRELFAVDLANAKALAATEEGGV